MKRERSIVRSMVFGLVLVLALGAAAQASIITQPTGLAGGDQYRLVFVTSGTILGTIAAGGPTTIGDYNTFATSAATAVSELSALGTTWTAIVSFRGPDDLGNLTTFAKDNTGTAAGTGVAIYNLGGLSVANDNADLWDGSIANPINVTETGVTLDDGTLVNTGSSAEGDSSTDLWMGKDPGGTYMGLGKVNLTDFHWIEDSRGPGDARPIYVMSGILTAVPEPATLGLLAIGGLAVLRRRRK